MSARLKAVPAEGGVESGAEGNGFTIEQLASETGFTVRNIRAHQARGLLPAPEVRARVGYYGSEHVARLQLIQELQADGFNLKGIKQLLDRSGESAERLLDVKQLATAPFGEAEPQVFTAKELSERFGDVHPKSIEKAERLGALVPLGDGRFEAPSPALLEAAEEAIGQGISLRAALTAIEQVQKNAKAAADGFVKLFLEEVWNPFAEEGYPEERWDEVMESIRGLRPMASKALLAVFQLQMTRAVEKEFGREIERRFGGRG
jgi:DNA-binding transcriptional MerR regulator